MYNELELLQEWTNEIFSQIFFVILSKRYCLPALKGKISQSWARTHVSGKFTRAAHIWANEGAEKGSAGAEKMVPAHIRNFQSTCLSVKKEDQESWEREKDKRMCVREGGRTGSISFFVVFVLVTLHCKEKIWPFLVINEEIKFWFVLLTHPGDLFLSYQPFYAN